MNRPRDRWEWVVEWVLVFAMGSVILTVIGALVACSLPNTIGLGYGNSSTGALFDDDDVQAVSLQAVWQIRANQVELVNIPTMIPQPLPMLEVPMTLPVPQELVPVEVEVAPSPIDIDDAVDTFILLNPWVQVVLVIAAVVLIFTFRSQLGRLLVRVIGRNGNGNGKKT